MLREPLRVSINVKFENDGIFLFVVCIAPYSAAINLV